MPTPNRGLAPIYTRLARAGRMEDYRLLMAYATSAPANDNNPPQDYAGADSVTETRPTVGELIAAGKDGVRRNRGKITSYLANGHWLPAREKYKQPKGGPANLTEYKADEAKIAERYIATPSTGSFPDEMEIRANYPSVGESFDRIRAAHAGMVALGVWREDRQLLASLGVDGAVPYAQARANAGLPVAKRGETAIAYGAEFIGGRTEPSDLAHEPGVVGGHDAVESTMATTMDRAAAERVLGQWSMYALDLALDGLTAHDIALALGYGATKACERKAVAAMDDAIEKLKAA